MAEETLLPAWAEIDLAALAHNVAVMSELVAPARVCAVVKADAYGHGAVEVARAAVDAGAAWLAVTFPEEGIELRRAGIAAPILVLVEPPPGAMKEMLAAGLTATVYTAQGVAAAAAAAAALGTRRLGVHLKVDTGMHRVGASPAAAVELAVTVDAGGWLRLEGLWTHLAVADDPSDPLTELQLSRFESVRASLAGRGVIPEIVHAANSAGAIHFPSSRYDLVRCGGAVYGCVPVAGAPGRAEAGAQASAAGAPGRAEADGAPGRAEADGRASGRAEADGRASGTAVGAVGLRPVLSLRSRVALVRERQAGDGVSYGQRYKLAGRARVATVPIGYADGVPRRLFEAGMVVLIRGRRRPLAGSVTMNQILVDCGPECDVCEGDEVVLLGNQGSDRITAEDWAAALDTISYEVLCTIGPRVPRVPASPSAPFPAGGPTSTSRSRVS